ncbi:hypothetical protein OAJ95_03790 [Pelagibacteraceae bacterium]|nr:hypothetical protein [Pelagibacteraceae bacterium]
MNKINEISFKELIKLILNNKFKLLIFNIFFLIPLIFIVINLDILRTEYKISIRDNSKLLKHDDFYICSLKYETIYFPEAFIIEFLALKTDLEKFSFNYLCPTGVYHEDDDYFRPQSIISVVEIYNLLIEKLDFDKKFLSGTSFESKEEFIKYYDEFISKSKVYKNNSNSAVNLLFKHKNKFKIDDLVIVLQNLYRDYYKQLSFSKNFIDENQELNTIKIINEFENYTTRIINYVEADKLKLIKKIQQIGTDGELDYNDLFKYLADNKFENLILMDTLRNLDKKIQIEVVNTIKNFSINPEFGLLGVKEDIKTIVKINNNARDELIKNNTYIEDFDYFNIKEISSKISINTLYISLISIIIYNFILLNLLIIFLYKKD